MGDNDNERLARLEEGGRRTEAALERLADAVSRQADAIADLAAIKIDHERHSSEINQLRQRVSSLTADLQRMNVLQTEQDYTKRDVEELKSDVNRIKIALPNMQLASGWVFKAILGTLAILGTSSVMNNLSSILASGAH